MSAKKFKTRGLKKDFMMPFTNDVVHRSIKLCPLSKLLMSTPQMQRLKGLKQLGVSEILYMCATHNRFQHSLGVMALAERLLRGISERQPRLDVTEKDVMCVKIAGLLHDVGHGPYSHVYDGLFRKQLKEAEKRGEWLGQKFDNNASGGSGGAYDDFPMAAPEGWAHEDASLMMIDDMLRGLGLQIDGNDLDAPLRQIGDGVDARRFGVWDRSSEPDAGCFGGSDEESESDDDDDDDSDGESDLDTPPLPPELVLTSRDWIFIKECISGGPLPPPGVSIAGFKKSRCRGHAPMIGRTDPHKEFLYDIVSNRHSGLDVDKMDYLARDTLQAHAANIADLLPKLEEKAFVCWAECGDRSGRWKCGDGGGEEEEEGRNNRNAGPGVVADDDHRPGMHTMICYPDSMVQNAMSFFEKRFEEHSRLYTHGKTTAGNYMICDIFLLADPHFRIAATNDGADFLSPPPPDAAAGARRVPISRAMVDPAAYLELTDAVLDRIMNDDRPELRPARILIRRFRSHDIYKRIRAPQEVLGDAAWEQKLWGMTEAEIAEEILKLGDDADREGDALRRDDIIVEKRKIHHGMKEENPVNFMRFLPKEFHRQLLNRPERLPTARRIPEASYRKPDAFLQKSVRVYCRSVDKTKHKRLGERYEEFIGRLRESSNEGKYSAEFEYFDDCRQTPTRPHHSAVAISQSPPPSVSRSPIKYDDDDDVSPPSSKRQKRYEPKPLFAQVKKRSSHR